MDSDAEVAAARLGRTVGNRWRLERVLGLGGMAAVYEARDASGAIAAVKILHPEMSARREVRERFLREGYAANKIGHAGVVQALEHGDRDSDVFLAMELLEGETLRSRVQRHGRLPLAEVLDYAEQVLDVLLAAHAKGVVHRDLKPDNLFITNAGRIKVLDFGLARLLDGVPGEHRTRTGVALGTLAYMAPEQALGRRAEIDGRVDLFALGATMFRILSGRRVHEAESEAELLMAMASRPAPPLATVAPDVPEGVGRVVDLALAFSRDARYPDAGTMLGDVRALRAGAAAPYATARLTTREEATRAEGPGASPRTQPMEIHPPAGKPNATVPLAAYVPASLPAPAPVPTPALGFPATEPPPISMRAPPASRTEPLSAQPPSSLQGYAQLMAAGAAAQPASAKAPVAASPEKQSSLGLLLVLGGLFVVGTGGLGLVWFFARSQGDGYGAVVPTPAPLPSALPAPIATQALAEPSQPTVPALAAEPGAVAPAQKEAEPAKPGAPRPASPKSQPGESGAKPSPTPSASAALSPTASAAPAPPPKPAPSPSSEAAPAPAPPVPPSPTAAPTRDDSAPRRGPSRRAKPPKSDKN